MSSQIIMQAAVSSVNSALNPKARFNEKSHRLPYISYRPIDEDFLGHGTPFEIVGTPFQHEVERENGKSTRTRNSGVSP